MKISVYITSYNQKDFLKEAFVSVISQSLQPHQIIVVDDCSSDGSQNLIRDLKARFPEKVTLILHDQNLGISRTRIDALNAATGDYVSYVDGDDRLLPLKLENEAKALRDNKRADIAFSNNYYMYQNGSRFSTWVTGEKPPDGNVFTKTLARDFPRQSLFRMELVNFHKWKAIGFHDSNLEIFEDWDMRIRLTKHMQTIYVNEPLSEIRTGGTGLSKAPAELYMDSFNYIYKKHRSAIQELIETDRDYVEQALTRQKARLYKKAAREAIYSTNSYFPSRYRGIRHYIKSLQLDPLSIELNFMGKLLLPRRASSLLRTLLLKSS